MPLRFKVLLCACVLSAVSAISAGGARAAEPTFDPAFDPAGSEGPSPTLPALAELAAANTVVFTGDELLRRGYRTVGEALAFEAGFVRERVAGGQRYTLYGVQNGIALIVDGVPLVVDGERDVLDVDDVLDLLEVERIEVVKGPSSTISGAGALTGTVRVTTRRPGVTGAVVRVSGAALVSSPSSPSPPSSLGPASAPIAGERSIAAAATVREGDLAARASVRLNSGAEQRWRLRDVPLRFERVAGVAMAVTKANVDVVTGDDTTLNLRASAALREAMVDVTVVHDLEQQPISDFSHGLVDTPQTQTREILRTRLLWSGDLGIAHVQTALIGAHHERELRVPLFPRAGLFNDGGLLVVAGVANTASALARVDFALLDGHRVLIAAFGDLTQASALSTSTDPIGGAVSDDIVEFDDVSGSLNGAIEYQGDFGSGWHATAGVLAFWRTGYRPGFSPRAALMWQSNAFSVEASYGEGVRAPDRFDVTALAKAVVDGRVVGAADNAALRPELVRTLQLGAGFAPSSVLRLSTRVFGLRHEDGVVAVQDGARLRPVNVAPRLLVGGDLSGDIAPLDELLHLRGGFVGTSVVDGGSGVILHSVIDASISPQPAFTFGARARAALREPVDRAVVDVYGTATVADVVIVTAVLRNAFDALEQAIDDKAPPFAEPVLYPGAGRTLNIAIEARF